MDKITYVNGIPCTRKLKSFSDPDVDFKEGYKNIDEMDFDSEIQNESRVFSIQSIKEKLRSMNYTPSQRMYRLIRDYKRFLKSNPDPEEIATLKILFIRDFNGIMSSVSEKIINGGSISSLLRLSSFGKDLNKSGRELSRYYKKSLLAEKSIGDIPKGIYIKLTNYYSKFMKDLITYVFEVPYNEELETEPKDED